MERHLTIRLSTGRKAVIHEDTAAAIVRGCRTWPCDATVARYASVPHEKITPEIVASARKRIGDPRFPVWQRLADV